MKQSADYDFIFDHFDTFVCYNNKKDFRVEYVKDTTTQTDQRKLLQNEKCC